MAIESVQEVRDRIEDMSDEQADFLLDSTLNLLMVVQHSLTIAKKKQLLSALYVMMAEYKFEQRQ